MDVNDVPKVALCVLKILERQCHSLPSDNSEFYTTYISLSPTDLDGRLCAGIKRFNINSLAPHSDTISITPFMAALLTQQFSLVAKMIDVGVPIHHFNTDNITPLLAACSLADQKTILWCATAFTEQEWKRSTGCYDPYQSDIPLVRLRETAPDLVDQVCAQWKSGERKPHSNIN